MKTEKFYKRGILRVAEAQERLDKWWGSLGFGEELPKPYLPSSKQDLIIFMMGHTDIDLFRWDRAIDLYCQNKLGMSQEETDYSSMKEKMLLIYGRDDLYPVPCFYPPWIEDEGYKINHLEMTFFVHRDNTYSSFEVTEAKSGLSVGVTHESKITRAKQIAMRIVDGRKDDILKYLDRLKEDEISPLYGGQNGPEA